MPNLTGSTVVGFMQGCMATGNGAYGLNGNATATYHLFAAGNRFRDNSSGNFANSGTNLTTEVNYTTDSDDASEYVDAANGDFRIKSTATIAGMGFGISVRAASGAACVFGG